MPIKIAAIADDYTGASDLANTWRKNGLRTVQTIGVPSGTSNFSDMDAVVVSLKIRSAPAADAVAQALNAEALLRDLGARHVLYKICSTFDSTDEGNIGPVMDALCKRANARWTLVTPAFPETGRTVYKGHLFVGDVPLNESPLKDHPLNPMRDANLVRVLSKQTTYPVGKLDLQTLANGVEASRARIAQQALQGPCAIIADAIGDGDLERLGDLALESPVSIGASGLGAGLARSLLRASGRQTRAPQSLASVGGFSAVLVGSCSARTLEQTAAAEKVMPVLRLDPDRLVASGGGDIVPAMGFARQQLGKGPFVVSASGTPETVRAIQDTYGNKAAGLAIETALAAIAAELVALGVNRLVVAGGETSGAVVDRLGISSFEVGEELAAGVPKLRTIGRAEGELMMALKSGNFGGIDFFVEALSRLD
jgi:uncharacterized protein YgbK (DUF1537 family)